MSCLASASIAVRAAVPARRIATARAAGSQRPVRVSAPGGAASTGRHQKAAFVPSSRRGGRVVADAVTDPDTADAFGVKKMNPEDIPPTALQFMVEMSCGKCVAAVESAVAAVAGVEAVTAALDTNTVRVVARLQQSDDVIDAITRAGYKCRLIGSGDVEGFGEDLAVRLGTDLRTLRQSLAAVAEFKGEVYGHGDVAGVVRFVAVNESTCLVEGAVQGLVPHGKYAVTVRTYGDTTRGVASTGGVYDCENENENEDEDGVDGPTGATPAGDLGTVTADANGKATIPSRVVDSRLKVWDVMGGNPCFGPVPFRDVPDIFGESSAWVDAYEYFFLAGWGPLVAFRWHQTLPQVAWLHLSLIPTEPMVPFLLDQPRALEP